MLDDVSWVFCMWEKELYSEYFILIKQPTFVNDYKFTTSIMKACVDHVTSSVSAYTVSKFCMTLYAYGLTEELRSDGIAVNGLWPKRREFCFGFHQILYDCSACLWMIFVYPYNCSVWIQCYCNSCHNWLVCACFRAQELIVSYSLTLFGSAHDVVFIWISQNFDWAHIQTIACWIRNPSSITTYKTCSKVAAS